MNIRERFLATMTFQEPGRIPIWEFGYWAGAIRRWYKEGLPKNRGVPDEFADGSGIQGEPMGIRLGGYPAYDVHDYFKMDPFVVRVPLILGAYPPFETKTVEDHDEWYIWQDEDGCMLKDRKDKSTLPSIVGTPVKTREDWERYKAERLRPTLEGRLPADWPQLVEEFKKRDYPIGLGGLYGFFGTPRYLLGAVELLLKYYDDPDLMRDMTNYLADFWIALYNGVLEHIDVDIVYIWEDMSYKGGPLISPEMFREFLLPCYKKLTSFLKESGVKVIAVDSDGDVWKLIPLWMEGGVNALYPFEVAAGMNVVEVRKAFPDLGIIGGIDKRAIVNGKKAIDEELDSKLPFMLKHGGYIPTIDHLVTPEASFENFKYYRHKLEEIAKKCSTSWDR